MLRAAALVLSIYSALSQNIPSVNNGYRVWFNDSVTGLGYLNGLYIKTSRLLLSCDNTFLVGDSVQGSCGPSCNFTGGAYIFERPPYYMYMDASGLLTIRSFMDFGLSNPCYSNHYPGVPVEAQWAANVRKAFRITAPIGTNGWTIARPLVTDFSLQGRPTTGVDEPGASLILPAVYRGDIVPPEWTIQFETPNPSSAPTSTPITSPPTRTPTTPIPTIAPATSTPSTTPTQRPTKNPIAGSGLVPSLCESLTIGGQWASNSAFFGPSNSPQFNKLANVTRGSPLRHDVWSNGFLEIQYVRLLDLEGHWVIGNSSFSLVSLVINASVPEPHNGIYHHFAHNNVLGQVAFTVDLIFACTTVSRHPTQAPAPRPTGAPTPLFVPNSPTFSPTVACVGNSNGLEVDYTTGSQINGPYYKLPTKVNNRPQWLGVGHPTNGNRGVRLFHDAILQAWVLHHPSTHISVRSYFYPSNEMGPPLFMNATFYGEQQTQFFNPATEVIVHFRCYSGPLALMTEPPTVSPTKHPSTPPTTAVPTTIPTMAPSSAPSTSPTTSPSSVPSVLPTQQPTTACATLILSGAPPDFAPLNGQYVLENVTVGARESWLSTAFAGQRILFAATATLNAWVVTGPVGYMSSNVNPFNRPPLNVASPWTLFLGTSQFSVGEANITVDCSATRAPTQRPSNMPSPAPSSVPSQSPTSTPTAVPSNSPTTSPSQAPSKAPTTLPSDAPSATPSSAPSASPTPLAACSFLTVNVHSASVQLPSAVFVDNTTLRASFAGYRQFTFVDTTGSAPRVYRIRYDETAGEWQFGRVNASMVLAFTAQRSYRPPADARWMPRTISPAFLYGNRRRLLSANTSAPTTNAPSGTPVTMPPTGTPSATPGTSSPSATPTANPLVAPIQVTTSCSETLAPTATPSRTPSQQPSAAPTNACRGLHVDHPYYYAGLYDRQPTLIQGKLFWKRRLDPPARLYWHLGQWVLSGLTFDSKALRSGHALNPFAPRGNHSWYQDIAFGGGLVWVSIRCESSASPSVPPTGAPSSPSPSAAPVTSNPTVDPQPQITNCPSDQVAFTGVAVSGGVIPGTSAMLHWPPLQVKSVGNSTISCTPDASNLAQPVGNFTVTCVATDAGVASPQCQFQGWIIGSLWNTTEVCRLYGPHVSVIVNTATQRATFGIDVVGGLRSTLTKQVHGQAFVAVSAGSQIEPCFVYADYYPASTVSSAIAAATPSGSGAGSSSTTIFQGVNESNLIWEILIIVLLVLALCLCAECLRRKFKERNDARDYELEPMLSDHHSATAMAGIAGEDAMRRATVTNQIQEKTRTEVPADSGFSPKKRMASAKDLGVAAAATEDDGDELEMVAPASPKMVVPGAAAQQQTQVMKDEKLQSGAYSFAAGEVPGDSSFWKLQLNNLNQAGYPDNPKNLGLLQAYAVRDTHGEVDRERTQHLVHNVLWHESTSTTPGQGANDQQAAVNNLVAGVLPEVEDSAEGPPPVPF